MTYEPKTTRMDLGGGNFAVLFQELRHGTQRKVGALTRPFLKYTDGKPPKLTIQEGEGEKATPILEGSTKAEIDLDVIDFDAVNDTIIIGQVQKWSFGPVDQETLDNIPEAVRGALVEKCNELYGAAGPLQNSGVGN